MTSSISFGIEPRRRLGISLAVAVGAHALVAAVALGHGSARPPLRPAAAVVELEVAVEVTDRALGGAGDGLAATAAPAAPTVRAASPRLHAPPARHVASEEVRKDGIASSEPATLNDKGPLTELSGASGPSTAAGEGASGRGDGTAGGGGGRGSGSGVAHGARLIAVGDPCHGVFPVAAGHDFGSVTVDLEVTNVGAPQAPRVLSEMPRGEGFAAAASTCLRRLRFRPATDLTGAPIASHSTVRLRFARN